MWHLLWLSTPFAILLQSAQISQTFLFISHCHTEFQLLGGSGHSWGSHHLVGQLLLQLAIQQGSSGFFRQSVFDRRLCEAFSSHCIKSGTDSESFCIAYLKFCVATAVFPGSNRLQSASSAPSKFSFSSGSCSEQPFRWPASCSSFSSAVQPFYTLALSKEGSQSCSWHSKSSLKNCVTGEALP